MTTQPKNNVNKIDNFTREPLFNYITTNHIQKAATINQRKKTSSSCLQHLIIVRCKFIQYYLLPCFDRQLFTLRHDGVVSFNSILRVKLLKLMDVTTSPPYKWRVSRRSVDVT